MTHSLNASSPKSGYIIGNATATTNDVVLGIVDIKAENKDTTIKTFNATMTDVSGVASALKLYDGSTLVASIAGANGAVSFANLSILIAKDTTKTLTLKADLKPVAAGLIDKVISASIAHTDITAIDANDDAATITAGTVVTKLMTVHTKAPILTLISTNIVKTTQAGSADQADATIVFDVTAQGGDIYIDKASHVLGTITVDDGVTGADAFAGAEGTYTFTSTAESATATSYLIRSGQTARFTVSGHVINKATTGFAHMAIDSLI